jgi:isopentenyl phosphate kinase
VQRLNNLVLASLHNHDLPAVSIPPHAVLTLSNHKPVRVDYSIFQKYLDLGFLPVSYGDVALDKKLGFSIYSGDLLVQQLAAQFKPEKVIFVMDEDGLYTANPKKDKHAVFLEKVTIKDLQKLTTKADSHADVTKGMEGKLKTIQNIAKNGVDTVLLNGNVHNRLFDTLKGKKTKSTLIHGEGT